MSKGSATSKKRRILIVGLVTISFLVIAYLLLTAAMPHPEAWSRVEEGMARDEANSILYPGGTTSIKNEYVLYRRVGLRLWWLNITFESNRVARVRISAEDPHDTLIQEIDYIRAYLPSR